LKVCHKRIKAALDWLKKNNEAYFDIEIDEQELEKISKVEYYY
jgi:hypothetical protein